MRLIFLMIMIPLVSFSVNVIFTPLEDLSLLLGPMLRAEESIFMVTYSLDHPLIIEALENAWKSGIDVRVISEVPPSNAHFPVQIDAESSLIHMKFVVIDGSILIIGSSNFTASSLHQFKNDILVFEDASLASHFVSFFMALWDERIPLLNVRSNKIFITNHQLELLVLSEISKARKSVKVMMFAFTHPKIWSTLKVLSSRGVKVEILVDKWFFKNSDLSKMPFSGFNVKLFKDFTVHSKVFIIDDSVVITGSANATVSAYSKNAEVILLIKDKDIVEKYLTYFDSVWQGGEER